MADEAALVKDLGKLFAKKIQLYMENAEAAAALAQKGSK